MSTFNIVCISVINFSITDARVHAHLLTDHLSNFIQFNYFLFIKLVIFSSVIYWYYFGILDSTKDQLRSTNERMMNLQQECNQLKDKISEVSKRNQFLKVCFVGTWIFQLSKYNQMNYIETLFHSFNKLFFTWKNNFIYMLNR